MACRLVESLGAGFDPELYQDEHRERVLALIERKARGEEAVAGPEPERPPAAPDLMAALEASIASAGGGEGDGGGRSRRSRPGGGRDGSGGGSAARARSRT